MKRYVYKETFTAEVCHVLNEYGVLLYIVNPLKSMSQPVKTIKLHYKVLAEMKDWEIVVYCLAGVLKMFLSGAI